ncbi:MAG: putative spheroidene monooxygenase [Frankiales bacterium]|nr:putative spheroidene monooxygenase [Frankiales bacterium]
MEPVPALVTLHVWRVARSSVPAALMRMGVDRARARRTEGVRFAKMLGTGRGFSLSDADLTRWAKLSSWSAPGPDPVAASWERLAEETLRLELRPLASTGRWSRRAPFGDPTASRYDGQVAALTRARLVPTQALSFWRAVPAVHADLARAPGMRAALGVGEAPLGLQGTFSVWDSAAALSGFTSGAAHQDAVRQTTRLGWYAEELFARFAVLSAEGTLNGHAL